jgi:5-formyltetrahydrofolate cyclo-ligase
VPLDLVVTPERTIRPHGGDTKPSGIAWGVLEAERIDEIPILSQLRAE